MCAVSCATAGLIIALNPAGGIFSWNGRDFEQLPGALSSVDIGVDGTLVGCNALQDIYMFDRARGDWVPLPGKLVNVTVGDGNRIFGTNAVNDIFRFDPAIRDWRQVPGKAASVSAAYDGGLFAHGVDGNVYTWDHARSNWVPMADAPTRFRAIAVGAGTKAVGVQAGAGEVWVRA
jgi:hypothetical protein